MLGNVQVPGFISVVGHTSSVGPVLHTMMIDIYSIDGYSTLQFVFNTCTTDNLLDFVEQYTLVSSICMKSQSGGFADECNHPYRLSVIVFLVKSWSLSP